jgi:hypothetical protein
MKTGTLPVRGYLLHITHYDPVWIKNKDKEKPFDLELGLEIVDAVAEAGMNLLMIDVKDGVVYTSHPELKRHYSQPISILTKLRERAKARGLEMAVKLNFSQSAVHQHNHWFRPHNDLFDNDEYWQKGFEVIDELIAMLKPRRFFHVGMDEDHSRSYSQYVRAIERLRTGLMQRELRTVIWNDSACHWPHADIHREKSLYAEERIPHDIIEVLWDYGSWDESALKRIADCKFDLWGAPGTDPQQVTTMRNNLLACGGTGILLTRWIPCIPENRESLLDHVRKLGPLC